MESPLLLFRGQGRGWGHFCNRMLFTAAGWERAPVLTEEKRAQIEESRVTALLRHASRPERSAHNHALPVVAHRHCDHRRVVARPSPLRSRLSRSAALPRDKRAAAS